MMYPLSDLERLSLAFCSTIRTVIPCSLRESILSMICCWYRGERAAVGSSRSRKFGFEIRALEIENIACVESETTC